MSKAEDEVVSSKLTLALDQLARVSCLAHKSTERLDTLDRQLACKDKDKEKEKKKKLRQTREREREMEIYQCVVLRV